MSVIVEVFVAVWSDSIEIDILFTLGAVLFKLHARLKLCAVNYFFFKAVAS